MATASVPPPSRMTSIDIIDVDALEENPIVYTGFRGRSQRSSPHQPQAGPSSSNHEHDDEITFTGFRRRSPGRAPRNGGSARAGPSSSTGTSGHDVIVLDSDDEMPPSDSGRRRPHMRAASRSRLMSPPPPAAQRGHTPGVPPLPPHLASQASFPRRHRAPDVPPPIRPVSQPLAFEERLPSLPRLPPRNVAHPPAAAPRSHHQPVMGFGGALLSLNRQNALQDAPHGSLARPRAEPRYTLPTFTEMLRRVAGLGGDDAYVPAPPENNARRWRHRIFPWYWDDAALDPDQELLSSFGDDDGLLGLPERLDAHRPAINLHHYMPKAETVSMWKPEYTHPDKTVPGFTHDFAPSEEPSSQTSSSSSPRGVIVLDEDEAGPSSGSASGSSSAPAVETTLVCARCLDPFILAPADGSSEEEVKTRRVWAMRCGHMLDGKCVAELMSPADASVETPPAKPFEETRADSRGKGKGKAREDAETPVDSTDPPPTSTGVASPSSMDRKGKRKAVEPLEPAEPPKRPALPAPSADSSAETEADNSIRSRLRSRTRAAVADVSPLSMPIPGSAAHVMFEDEEDTRSPLIPPRRGRRQPAGTSARSHGLGGAESRGKGKGKGRAKVERKPVVEAEHEWRCPVSGCGCVHYSVRIEGRWTNDDGRGPIALFV
ncbi:hypothetical protein C2E23DRAFT_735225 [Lenzites betulinus]|nr:hypothetical protein C2E23DRAFT_735225 [Lenzites betulinus]